ncbi:hypothetical protein [Nocardioides limicola]|uniref:hypothetical protein n=1 Tax=Nocardioides limicola TaxID=2803368 RepID=UPI00193B348E|nr:hypothetical protein [Nocardioides sp. DJM-14]
METLRLILLVIHILAIAALIGGLLAQVRDDEKRITGIIRDGVGTAFLTGLLLVGLLEAGDGDVNHAKVGVKFAIGLILLILVMANLRKPRIPQGLYVGLLAISVINVVVAVMWSPAHV